MKIFSKNCPQCGGQQSYSCKGSYNNALKKNKSCLECGVTSKQRKFPKMDIYKKQCPICKRDQFYSCRKTYKLSIKNNWKCKACSTKENNKKRDNSFFKSKKYRDKMSQSVKKSEKSKNKFTEEYREKLRIAKLKQIKEQGTQRTYNPTACQFIDLLNEIFGWNLQHGMNGGEIQVSGYSLDGYDKERNIVFEYDEPKHNLSTYRKKDKERENRIIQKINPIMFIRYNEEYDKLHEIVSERGV